MPKYTSKKNKSGRTLHDKMKLWDVFETEVGDKSKGTSSLECIYRECGDRECCDQCSFSLAFSEEGFLTCTNTKCGIIYKDTTDQTAEWRYYGADDNQSGDPTRCGMPINPLLKESSYGFQKFTVPYLLSYFIIYPIQAKAF